MKRILQAFVLHILCTCYSIGVYGLNPMIKDTCSYCIEADTIAQIGKNHRIRLKYQYKSSEDSIEQLIWNLTDSKDKYRVLRLPSKGSTSSSTIRMNGVVEKTKYIDYNTTLKFVEEGVFTIPPAIIVTKSGKRLVSNPFVIHVVPEETNEKFIVVEPFINMMNDSIICEVKLFTNYNIIDISSSKVEINNSSCKEQYPKKEWKEVIFNERKAKSLLYKKLYIIPEKSQTISIDSMKFYIKYTSEPYNEISDIFSINEKKDTIIYTNPLKIKVN